MDADLPKSVVKRLVKATLDRLDQCGGDGKTLQLNKDALLAMSESAKAFILYLTATAATHQASARRQTLLEADVYAALRDIQFGELVRPLKNEVAAEKKKTKEKGAAKKATAATAVLEARVTAGEAAVPAAAGRNDTSSAAAEHNADRGKVPQAPSTEYEDLDVGDFEPDRSAARSCSGQHASEATETDSNN